MNFVLETDIFQDAIAALENPHLIYLGLIWNLVKGRQMVLLYKCIVLQFQTRPEPIKFNTEQDFKHGVGLSETFRKQEPDCVHWGYRQHSLRIKTKSEN